MLITYASGKLVQDSGVSMLVERKFDTGEAILNYAEGPDNGPTLVFLHGLSDRWQFFLPILPSLSHRWHVYSVDFRGHGASSHTPPYRYMDHIQDIIKFIENLPEKPLIFASSLGGMISLMVAGRRPDLVKGMIFGDANIKLDYVRGVMRDYKTFWAGWEKIAASRYELDELVKAVAEMPISIPWRKPGKYGDGLDYVSILNKALYLRVLDSRVLTPWALGGEDDGIFREVTKGYVEDAISLIKCPVLIIQGNMSKGAILHDDEVKFALERIKRSNHVYLEQCDHNLGLYNHEIAPLMRVTSTFLESFR